jgi:hypothetical protein
MTLHSPAEMRRGVVLREDHTEFRRDGAPLSSRHITSPQRLVNFISHITSVMEVLAAPAPAHTLTPDNPAVTAARLSCDGYVLPPEYLRLKLRHGYRVLTNGPGRIPYNRYVSYAGDDKDGRYVAVHRLGLSLDTEHSRHVLLPTLAPNTRDTTPIIIGVQHNRLGEGLELRSIADAPEDNLLDPWALVHEQRTYQGAPFPGSDVSLAEASGYLPYAA